MIRLGFYICLNFIWFGVFSQIPTIEWQKSFGGTKHEQPISIKSTIDGGYIAIGYTESSDGDISTNQGVDDCWLIKLSALGSIQWQKTYGGYSSEYAKSVLQCKDSGYIFVGSAYFNDTNVTVKYETGFSDMWAVKVDKFGNLQWERSYGGTRADDALSVVQTSDNGYVIGGISWSNDGDISNHHGTVSRPDYCLIKINAVGNIQWQRSYGGSYAEWLGQIKQTSDNGFILAGASDSKDGDITNPHIGTWDNTDFWVVKTDSLGILQWQRSLGGTNDDDAVDIILTKDKGYAVAGCSRSTDGDVTGFQGGFSDFWIVKMDSVGNKVWAKMYGGSDIEVATSLKQTIDGNYLILGGTESNDGDVTGLHGSNSFYDFWLIKTDPSGNLIWQKCYGGSSSDSGNCIELTTDGGCVMLGGSHSIDGDITDGHHGSVGYPDFCVIKLSSVYGISELENSFMFSIFPNPTTGILFLYSQLKIEQVQIINALGERMKDLDLKITQDGGELDISSYAKGFYIIQVTTVKGMITGKVVVD